ncbi:hypothetical protein [Allomesorhizobium alhagi]|jgi:hypothetical protein|uniref:Transmembrane protein n=1 Tax=Mesorhizobium alhagi CCNWXJ12-2 TaxID=1107882 RepID=H0HPT5_9HYPH|nr:hypothetical protein [Mesorhizobium alhagi]EHK57268.1 hypothetical protein MAXJ12_10827 [Mesorhizobium alhagi CCNWXJ12-2]
MDGNSGGLDAALLGKHRAVCENALQRLTSGLGPDDVAARNAAYAKIRDSNESFIAKNAAKFGDAAAAALRVIVEEIIAQDARDGPMSAASDGEDHASGLVAEVEPINRTKAALRQGRSALFGGLVGAGLAVLAGIGLWMVDGAWSSALSPTERQREFEAQFEKSLPKIDVAVRFLERVEQEVIKRQKTDGAAFAALASKGLMTIDKLLPELAKEMPKELPPRAVLYIAANTVAYKIVFRSVLCTAVEFARPAMVDLKRNDEGLGCEFFGVWNEAGAKI